MLDRTKPDDLVADLKRDRTALAERLAELNATRSRLRAAEDDEAKALNAVGAVGATELAAMRAWANAGAHGDPPAIDPGPRAAATAALATAQAKAAAARAAGSGVDAQVAAIHRDIAAIGRELERAALGVIVAEFIAERDALDKVAAEIRARVAATFAAVQYIRELGDAHRIAGRVDDAQAVFAALQPMIARPVPDFAPSVGDVGAEMPAWAARYRGIYQ